jgi:hypothetical protein
MRKLLIILALICLPAMAKPPAQRVSEPLTIYIYPSVNLYDIYFQRLAFYESSNTWDTINQIGAMGKYQFLASTLSDLGVYITPGQFAANPGLFGPEMQDSLIRVLTARNEVQLNHVINAHPEINKFAILAAAHLAGVRGVTDYFNLGIDRADGNGTKITEYLKKFN